MLGHMSDETIKVFIGTNERGARLKNAIRKVAEERRMGNMSRLLISDFCEKYGYDFRTGKHVALPTGSPQTCDSKTKCKPKS
jgi:hypothetical protein